MLHYVAALRLSDFVNHTWRPILSAAIMVLVLAVFPRTDGLELLAQVILSIAVGAGVYAISIFFLWRVSGCGDGAESYMLEQIGIKNRILQWMQVTK